MSDEVKSVEEQIAEAIAKVNEEWQSKFQGEVNKASKAEREKFEKKLKEATMSEAERIQAEREEEFKKINDELTSLKSEKLSLKRKQLLTDHKLPAFYENDVRLREAPETDYDSVIKQLSKEHTDYVKSITQGQVSGTAPIVPDKTQVDNPISPELLKRFPHLK